MPIVAQLCLTLLTLALALRRLHGVVDRRARLARRAARRRRLRVELPLAVPSTGRQQQRR